MSGKIEGLWRLPKNGKKFDLRAVHQGNLSKALGIHESHTNRLFEGHFLRASFVLVYRMAKLLEVSMEDISEAFIMERYRYMQKKGEVKSPTPSEE